MSDWLVDIEDSPDFDMVTLKAFRVGKNGEPRYLFHGNFGNTEVPLDTWIEADARQVRDGTSSTYYESAFHSMPDYDAVKHWERSLTSGKGKYVVCPVMVRETRLKSHSKHRVILSKYLYVPSSLWNGYLKAHRNGECND